MNPVVELIYRIREVWLVQAIRYDRAVLARLHYEAGYMKTAEWGTYYLYIHKPKILRVTHRCQKREFNLYFLRKRWNQEEENPA